MTEQHIDYKGPSIKFCQEPSKYYLEMLEECGGDPRSVAGIHAMREAGALARGGVATRL